VSGATATSKAVLAAVEQALSGEAADAASYAINVGDGTHRGSAAGFGGELIVEVTVAGGEIAEIEVVEHSETPFIADGAIKELLPAIIAAQGPVDTVSGATATSKAVLSAVEAAVTK
ncbi:MAG: FMN-binding protein, partial [Firmicutes bacterium]|nr:FMN-binding protein [Bacillota bacterium]